MTEDQKKHITNMLAGLELMKAMGEISQFSYGTLVKGLKDLLTMEPEEVS